MSYRMKQERIILSFIMVLIGLLVAGALFYFYQSTKVIPTPTTSIITSPIPTPKSTSNIFLSVTNPTNEQVVANKTVQIMGKTIPGATVIVITDSGQQVFSPSAQGDFSTTITIQSGENSIEIRAIAPNGETTSMQRTVTYSTEDF